MGRLDHFKTGREPKAHEGRGTYCGTCGLFLKKGRPKWLVAGVWHHHHCARYLPDPPVATVCQIVDCPNSTSVIYEGAGFEILPVCWLHQRAERAMKGLGLAGDLQRRAEQKATEADGDVLSEEEWLASKGMHAEGSVVDGT